MLTRREWLAASAVAATAAPIPELCTRSAVELAALLRAKKVSAREVLDAHLKRIEDVNPKLNAIITLVPEMAREAAQRADESAAKGRFLGPLHGLPIAHKDLQETKGIRTTYGSPIYKDNVPDRSTLAVERIQRAGAITVGKTNVPEFGAGSHTFNPVFGATKNPYNLNKTCGGSSGGAGRRRHPRSLGRAGPGGGAVAVQGRQYPVFHIHALFSNVDVLAVQVVTVEILFVEIFDQGYGHTHGGLLAQDID